MADKEQIIIDGIAYYKQQDINKGLDEEHYITEFHLLATHYNLLLKDYARKTQECEELKKANQHIDTNRQCKGSKLKRIEELISDCETGYTDEFIQKIYGIIQEPEPTVNDYSITDRYRKALEEIEKVINNILNSCLGRNTVSCRPAHNVCGDLIKILDIINKAKEGE